MTFQAGERATLACVAQGYPVPNCRWRRHFGEELSLPGHGGSVRQENGIILFEKITAANAGKYTCYATNTLGDDKMDVEIIVEGKDKIFMYTSMCNI